MTLDKPHRPCSERHSYVTTRVARQVERWIGAERAAALQHLRDLAEHRPLTLLTATKHPDISEATVLADLLRH